MKNKFGKVAVLMGGEGSEREISLMSGHGVLQALQSFDLDVYGVDVGPNICEHLFREKYDRAFVAMHGTLGEDGTLQGMLEYLKIPYTGSGVAASAIAMDKEITKLIWQAQGLPTLPFMLVDENTNFSECEQKLGLPLAIKPTVEGSSLGVTKVNNAAQFFEAIKLAKKYYAKVMVEHWVEGDELTVGILNREALPVIRITTDETFYDYHAKYFSDVTGYHIPSGLSDADEKEIQTISLRAFNALNCKHWGRVDAMRDKKGKYWLLEVNTIPGLTSHSLVPKAAKAIGIDYANLILRILEQTL